MGDEVEETNSGVRKEGDIEEIAEFTREVEDVMKEEDIKDDSIEKFKEWRPREKDGKKDIERKTVEAATIPQKELEEKSKGVKDIEEAGSETVRAGKKISQGKAPGDEVKDASKKFLRPIYSFSAKVTRNIEEKVYSNLMLKFNPYFFDTEDFSVDLRSKNRDYIVEVDVTDKSSRDRLKDKMARED